MCGSCAAASRAGRATSKQADLVWDRRPAGRGAIARHPFEHSRMPEACQRVAGGRSEAQTPGQHGKDVPTPQGSHKKRRPAARPALRNTTRTGYPRTGAHDEGVVKPVAGRLRRCQQRPWAVCAFARLVDVELMQLAGFRNAGEEHAISHITHRVGAVPAQTPGADLAVRNGRWQKRCQ